MMLKYFSLFVLAILFNICSAQEIKLKVDSIKVYHLPFNLKSRITLNAEAVRGASENQKDPTGLKKYRKVKTLKDENVLKDFCNINLLDNSLLIKAESIDVRMVIDVYIGQGYLTISLDYLYAYSLMNSFFVRQTTLVEWIDNNIK